MEALRTGRTEAIQVSGYVPADHSADTCSRLSEGRVIADSEMLRSLATFLTKHADRMNESSAAGVKFGDQHFRDRPSSRRARLTLLSAG